MIDLRTNKPERQGLEDKIEAFKRLKRIKVSYFDCSLEMINQMNLIDRKIAAIRSRLEQIRKPYKGLTHSYKLIITKER